MTGSFLSSSPSEFANGTTIALVRSALEMLQRAIFNLAENAIKFTAKDTSVDVECVATARFASAIVVRVFPQTSVT